MAFVFWRRVQGNRRWGGLNATIPLNERSIYFNLPFSNADIPKLWDLSNGGNFARGSNQEEKEGAGAGEGLSDVTWVNLMVHIAFFKFLFSFSFLSFVSLFHYETKKKPISGRKFHVFSFSQPLSVSKEVIHSSTVADDGSMEPRLLQQQQQRHHHPLNNPLLRTAISNLNPLSWRRRRRMRNRSRQSPSRPDDHDDNNNNNNGGEEEKKSEDDVTRTTLRVAITIALPSPEYLLYWHV